jgi:hypothetical protein
MRTCFLLLLAPFVLLLPGVAADNKAAAGWSQVQGLGPHTLVHIKGDKQSAVCFLHSVEDQQLTCGRSEAIGSPVIVFLRSDIKTIKLSRKSVGTRIDAGPMDNLFDGALIYQR